MKPKYIYAIFIYFLMLGYSHAQNWIWSKQIGGNSFDGSGVTCMDASNNLYVTGIFVSNPCYFNSDTLSPNGESDFFIAKYDPSGNELWVKSYGGFNPPMQSEVISAIAYDAVSNCIYFTGHFTGTCIFDTTTLLSSGSDDAFIAKLDLNGNIKWVKKSGGAGEDFGAALAISADGSVFVEYCLSAVGVIDTMNVNPGVYFVKYDINGVCMWVKKKFNYINSNINFDALFVKIIIKDNKIFGIGSCSVDTFNIDTINVYANYPNGQCIIGCLDTSGNALWIKTCANSNVPINDNIIDNNKNIFVTGYFSQDGIFENDTLHSTVGDLFLAKYDSTGHKIWVFQTNSSNGAIGSGLCFDPEGNFYFTGTAYGTATFGNYTINPTTTSMFLARFDTAGSCIGVRYNGFATGMKVLVDLNGNAYVNGGFQNTIAFDSNPTMTSYGNSDIYIAKSSAIVGIGEEEARPSGNQLIIYANPNSGTCNVSIPEEFKNDKNLTLQLFDNAGKLLQQTKVEMKQGKLKINLEEEAKGIYHVILSNGKKQYTGKVIFE